jgi:hypothetical protein
VTEAEWDACADPQPMLEFLRGTASDRKLRLFAVACCRHIWRLIADERSRKAVEAAERFVEVPETCSELGKVRDGSLRAVADATGDTESAPLGHTKWHAACAAVFCTDEPLRSDGARDASEEARRSESCYAFESANPGVEVPYPEPEPVSGSGHAALLRCVFGDPFRPAPAADPSWLAWNGSTVAKLAAAVYDGRRFADLPILADALEDAGCTDATILSHCRGGGEHVRGCWVVDLLTARG